MELDRQSDRGWTISLCAACDVLVEACRCDPLNWVTSTGEQLEPPSRTVRVEESA